MSDILTLTMNPALDVLAFADKVESTHKIRCGEVIKHPGGGGVNVARVLHRLGASCVAVFVQGGVTGERHHHLLTQEKVRCHAVPIAQETRESFSVHEARSGQDFRFVLPGPTLSASEYETCFDYIAQHLPKKFLVISGGLAPGVPTDFYARLVALAKQHHVKVVLDANGPALALALQQSGVYLFKPSWRELQELTGEAMPNEAAGKAAAQHLIQSGQAQLVALSLGDQGAMLVSATQAWRAPSLKVDVQTTIGAGDSFVGGMVWALSQNMPLQEAFRHAMAASAAALLAPGTPLCQAADVQRLLAQVVLRPM